MSNDISRVYQFLAKQGDWIAAADANGDGSVIKTEFRNFMKESFEWDGETTDAGKNDLINTFWESIDTNQSGKISGTRLKNKNALDSKEIDSMSNTIEIYEILNNYTASLKAPNIISDAANWKKSVSEGLAALTETYIKEGGKAENLEAYLAEKAPAVMRKATADYCANEYLKSEMSDFVKEYAYSYADDNTLQGIIDTYIQNIPADVTDDQIKETVIQIIDAYLSTAGLKDGDTSILAEYGYEANDNLPLNDLQKSIVTKNVQTALEELKNNEDYAENSELYDSVINDYITNLLNGATYGDFDSLKDQSMEMFQNSDEYKNLSNLLAAQGLLTGDDLYNKISSEIGSSLADIIKNDSRYLDVVKDIQAQLMEKVKAGEFINNGELDEEQALDWVLEQIQSRISEFYQGNLSGLSVSELNAIYEQLYNSANAVSDDEKSLEAHRNAALTYCNAIADKDTSLKNAVTQIFGNNFEETIQGMLPSQILESITELQDIIKDYADASELVIEFQDWGIADSFNLEEGDIDELTLNPTFRDQAGNVKNIAADRISYISSDTSLVNVDSSGKITIQGKNVGTFTATISISVDGKIIGSKTITIKCDEKELTAADLLDKANFTGVGDPSGGHLEVFGTTTPPENTQVINSNFADLYNGNAIIQLHREKDDNHGRAKDRLGSLITIIIGGLVNAGLDRELLKKAAATVKQQYDNVQRSTIRNNWEDDELARYAAGQIQNGSCSNHNIVNYADTKKRDYNVYMVSFRGLVDDIIAAYNKLV